MTDYCPPQVCDYAIEVTNGSKEANVVPIGVRQPLLQTWVLAKQMAQQQIPKTLGADDEVRGTIMTDHIQAIHWMVTIHYIVEVVSFDMLKSLHYPRMILMFDLNCSPTPKVRGRWLELL